jgi:Tol biopolymer transport system component
MRRGWRSPVSRRVSWRWPSWSPDGEQIAYVGANAGTEWISRDLYLVDWQGQKPRQRLTRVGDGEFFSSPSWSPDGGRIAFVELDSGRVFVGDAP